MRKKILRQVHFLFVQPLTDGPGNGEEYVQILDILHVQHLFHVEVNAEEPLVFQRALDVLEFG